MGINRVVLVAGEWADDEVENKAEMLGKREIKDDCCYSRRIERDGLLTRARQHWAG
jgi:hypothetical protein